MPSSPSRFLRAFLSSALGTAFSRVLGAMRDVAIAGLLGAGASSDAFFVAFTVPNTFRRFVADEGLTGALVPAVAKTEEEGGDAHALANTVLTFLLALNVVFCGLGMLFPELLVHLFAAAFAEDPDKFALTASMTRWLMPFLAMVSVVSFFEGLLNHRGHFFVPKVAPGMVSLGVVAAVVGAHLLQPEVADPAWILVGGVLVGGGVHVLVNLPVLRRLWGPLSLSFAFSEPRFRGVVGELAKVVAIGIFAQINLLVLRQLAAAVGDGAVTHYWNANRLVDLSQGIIAVAIGSALLPGISRAVAARDFTAFERELSRSLRLAGFLLIPVAAVLIPFALPITAILFRHGAYSWEATQITASSLQLLVPMMLAIAGINIIKKAFFALERRNPLLGIGALGVLTTGILGWLLVDQHGVLGLCAALSLSTVLQLIAYFVVLRSVVGPHLGLDRMVGPLVKMTLAALPTGAVLWLAQQAGDWSAGPAQWRNWLVLGGGLTLAGGVYLGLAWLLKIEELTRVVERLRARTQK